MAAAADGPFLDASAVQWAGVSAAVFAVRQTLRYEYPGPIADVHHRLMLVPPDICGAQRLLDFTIAVEPQARPRLYDDQFGNRVCAIALPAVERSLAFVITLRVERRAGGTPPRPHDAPEWYTLPSPLTERSAELDAIAAQLAAEAADPPALADRINAWVFDHLRYTPGVTGVSTTALDAYERGEGVCQDYAHLMIALCRAAGLPARYVSGHLLGEGAMHAWTQVLLPDRLAPAGAAWLDFDPTHRRRAAGPYVTVAVGRDYGDVSPTRGSFRAPYAGWLADGHNQAGLLALTSA